MNYTQKEIAKTLGWDEETIYRDIKKIRENLTNAVHNSEDEPVIKMIHRKEQIIKDAYTNYLQANDDKNKRAWLNIVQSADKELFDLLTRTGIIREAPKEAITTLVDPVKIMQEWMPDDSILLKK